MAIFNSYVNLAEGKPWFIHPGLTFCVVGWITSILSPKCECHPDCQRLNESLDDRENLPWIWLNPYEKTTHPLKKSEIWMFSVCCLQYLVYVQRCFNGFSGTRNQNRSAHASHEVLRYPLVIKLGNGQSPINGGFKWFCWKWPASQCIGTFLTESNMIHQYFSKFGDQWMSNHWRFCSSVVKPSNWHVVLPFFA